MNLLSSTNWTIRIATLMFVTFTYSHTYAQYVGVEEDTSLQKIRNTGYELLYSHASYSFYEMELLNESILLLQKTHDVGSSRLLFLNKKHTPTDTLDVNCWPQFVPYTNPLIWQSNDTLNFKPQMVYYTPEICNKDERLEKSELVLKFRTKEDELGDFSCETLPSTSFKDFKKWKMHSSFYHNGTTVTWVEKSKKKLSYGELRIGSKIIKRLPRERPYVISQYCLPVANDLIVLDAVEQMLYWAKDGEIHQSLKLENDKKISRIFYDKVSEKFYGDSYNLTTQEHSVYEIDTETGIPSLYATFPYYCYDLSIRNGNLYFIIHMSKIDPEFQTTGLFLKKMTISEFGNH